MIEVLYFGCTGRGLGHRLHSKKSIDVPQTPWGLRLDGGLLPQGEAQVQGELYLEAHGGWTVVAFWDRSGDARPNSNSAFLAHGRLTMDELIGFAREQWPEIFSRPGFPRLLYPSVGAPHGDGNKM